MYLLINYTFVVLYLKARPSIITFRKGNTADQHNESAIKTTCSAIQQRLRFRFKFWNHRYITSIPSSLCRMLLQSSRTDLPVVSPACFRRKEEFMCKVPWVLETQKHVLEKLSAWMADFSRVKRKLLN